MRRFGPGRPIFTLVAVSVVTLAALLAHNNVSVTLSADDEKSIPALLTLAGKQHLTKDVAVGRPFAEQVKIVSEVQAAILEVAPQTDPIDFNRGREPRDLLELRQGLCYDRSRAIEKVLTYVGLQTRHVSVYSLQKAKSALEALVTTRTPSHALTEVRTEKGWMAVDPDMPWIGLTDAMDAISIKELKKAIGKKKYAWNQLAKSEPNDILDTAFVYVPGLYSRHGRFYPPYNAIPDVNYPQLASGMVDLIQD